jgi:hypothetical protein
LREIKAASVSDVHLGHPNNETKFISDNLKAAFPDNEKTGSLDFLFIVGDWTHQLLVHNSEDAYLVDDLIFYFLRLCKKHNIRLRVLNGTPSHDYDQSRRFIHINEKARIGCDVLYVDKIDIIREDDFDLNILYIPDKWGLGPEDNLREVKDLMYKLGLEQVDLCLMHGQFPHQIPEIKKEHCHDPDEYLKIVKHLIFVGHIHFYSVYERIIAQGSFDRLAQGEEGPKGHVRAVIRDNSYEVVFVENKAARIFKTINCVQMQIDETLDEIRKQMQGIIDGSFIRIACQRENPILQNMNLLLQEWPFIRWSRVIKGTEEIEKQTSVLFQDEHYTPIVIRKDNIVDLIAQRLSQELTDVELLERSIESLREFV